MFNVRGARNLPCATVPGKRAPTVKMCESDENYVPLNDGYNWKGDPNATLSGQPVPQLPPQTPSVPGTSPAQAGPASSPPSAGAPATPPADGAPTPAPPPVSVAKYDPATGAYVGPDGKVYTQADLSHNAERPTWQSMLLPPTG